APSPRGRTPAVRGPTPSPAIPPVWNASATPYRRVPAPLSPGPIRAPRRPLPSSAAPPPGRGSTPPSLRVPLRGPDATPRSPSPSTRRSRSPPVRAPVPAGAGVSVAPAGGAEARGGESVRGPVLDGRGPEPARRPLLRLVPDPWTADPGAARPSEARGKIRATPGTGTLPHLRSAGVLPALRR